LLKRKDLAILATKLQEARCGVQRALTKRKSLNRKHLLQSKQIKRFIRLPI